MSWTYSTLSTALQDWTENAETTFVSNIPVFVKQAEDRIYHSVLFTNLRKHSTGNLVAGTATLSLPSDFIAPLSFKVTVSSVTQFLRLKSYDFLNEYMPTATNGTPKFYALKDDTTLEMVPPPASTYAYDLEYFYKPTSIVTASTTWLGTNHPSLLLYASLVEAYTFMKGEEELLGTYTSRYMEEVAKLKNTGEAKQLTDVYRNETRRERQ